MTPGPQAGAGRPSLVLSLWLALSLLPAGIHAQEAVGPAGEAATLVIRDVTVVDVTDGSLLAHRSVLIRDSLITAVEPAARVDVPEGATVVDGAGGYLVPGFWDMHVHAARAGRAPRFWPLFLAHGVTGVREMGSHVDSLLYWRSEARPGSGAPRIHWSSPMLDGSPPAWDHGIGVPDAEAARAIVDSMQGLGFDALKIYTGLPREAYLVLSQEARRRGVPFAGHVPLAMSPLEASEAGQRSFEHVFDVLTACVPQGQELQRAFAEASARHGGESDSTRGAMERLMGALAFSDLDPALCGPLLDRLVSNGTWLTPTLAQAQGALTPGALEEDPRLGFVPPDIARRWREDRRMSPEQEARAGRGILDNGLRAVELAHRAGVEILAGTDTSDEPYVFPGSSLHDEMALLVEAGSSPLEALRAATIGPARFLGRTDELGSVERGKLADLVLLDANPLEDVGNTRRIRAVVVNGRLLERAELDSMLAGVEEAVGGGSR